MTSSETFSCPTCEQPAVLQRLDGDRVQVTCGNPSCHLTFGFIFGRGEFELLCESKETDRVLAAEYLEL